MLSKNQHKVTISFIDSSNKEPNNDRKVDAR